MLRRTLNSRMFRSVPLLSGGGSNAGPPAGVPTNENLSPNQPWHINAQQHTADGLWKGNFFSRLIDQNVPLFDDTCRGHLRAEWQEPVRQWFRVAYDETIILEEHEKEEFNERPYISVNHLYEPPMGSEERPLRLECTGNPGDRAMAMCVGNCAPHVPDGTYLMQMRGYKANQCPMCQQWFYVHNRPWLIMHPDWTDDPASDDGPAYKFQEIEAEFDRDFHEFSIYLNCE